MNKLILFCLLAISFVGISQNDIPDPESYLIGGHKDTVVYLNESWCEVKDIAKAVFRQECKLDKYDHKRYHGKFKSYYMSNGKLRGKGRFKHGVDIGKAYVYYLDGTVMREMMFYDDGTWDVTKAYNKKGGLTFEKGLGEYQLLDSKGELLNKTTFFTVDSLYKEWYEGGVMYEKGITHKSVSSGYVWRAIEVYDALGNNVLDSTGSGYAEYRENGNVVAIGDYKKGYKKGLWYYYDVCTGELTDVSNHFGVKGYECVCSEDEYDLKMKELNDGK